MVDFQLDDDPKTTGDGTFLNQSSEEYISYYDSEVSKCSEFLIDPPPHDKTYFEDQITAVKNYYSNVSRGNIDIGFHIIDESFTVDHSMVYYSELSSYDQPDQGIVTLFSDGLDKAQDSIEEYLNSESLSANDVLFLMFHAGVGEDYGHQFLDPANYDIRSAYIDEDMSSSFTPENSWMDENNINKGILLPESLNLIYYDTIEDIYGNLGEDGLCGQQMGMTGLFSYLLGYEFGLPEMFDSNSNPGVGVFGLMDVGSFNGMGVMPSPPQAWTRVEMGWDNFIEDGTSFYQRYSRFNDENVPTSPRKIDINQSEYYLLEAVSNRIFLNHSIPDIIDSININNSIEVFEIPDSLSSLFGRLIHLDELNDKDPYNPNESEAYYTDIISYSDECDSDSRITIDPITRVVLCLANYDYGLPGSGMLIWHINESNESSMNSDINNRTVDLVEADVSQDIGLPNNAWPLQEHPYGWKYDLWFDGNHKYYDGNPNQQDINFNAYTQPPTDDSNGAKSYIAMNNFKSNILDDRYYIEFNLSIEDDLFIEDLLYPQPIEIFGAGVDNTESYILTDQGVFTATTFNPIDIENNGFVILQNDDFSSCTLNEYFDEECITLDNYIPKGNFYDTNLLPEIFWNIDFSNLAIGDIDQDGIDEVIEGTDSQINCYNPNGSICNGFPVYGNFYQNILISNILDESYPQIISRADESICIISYDGEIRHKISSKSSSNLYIVPNWDNQFGLIDGDRVLKFKQDQDLGYWLSPNGRSNNQPDVNQNAIYNELSSLESGKIDIFYNYPNPISDGVTKFRYLLGNDIDRIEIKIYSASGFLIETLSSNHIQFNEYNEIEWSIGDIPLGLYLANLILFSNSEEKDSKITKVLVTSKK